MAKDLTTRQLAQRIARAVRKAETLSEATDRVLDVLHETGTVLCKLETDARGESVEEPLP